MSAPAPRSASAALSGLAACLPGLAVLAWGATTGWGGSKDDTWISFRYARNLLDGHGLTFNPGEPPVEGYTNFLWTLAMVPGVAWFEDAHVWAGLLGVACTAAAVCGVVGGVRALGGSLAAAALGGLAFAAWPDVLTWSVAGLEQGMVLAFAATGLWAALVAAERRTPASAVVAGLLLAGGCLTRPEGHAIAGVAVVALAAAGAWRSALVAAGTLGAVLAPYHAWRLATFGSLVPNTYWVKSSAGFENAATGLGFLGEMLWDGQTWIVLALAAATLGLAPRPKRLASAAGLAVIGILVLHLVKVGHDEFPRFRLFLPAWPAAAALAAWCVGLVARPGARAAAAAALLGWTGLNLAASAELLPARSDEVQNARFGHANVGKWLARHAAAGERVAIQDIGAPAYFAPDLRFLDTIGLTDTTITALYAKYDYQPFARAGWKEDEEKRAALEALNAEGRAYLERSAPDWVAYVAVIAEKDVARAEKRWREKPDENPVDRWLVDRPYYYGWAGEDSFRERYTYVRAWRRNSRYWVTAWRRNDHLARPPAEVVVAEAPADLLAEVDLPGGHRVLAGTVTPTVATRDEAWVDVYVEAGGPGEAGTLVDVEFWPLRSDGTRRKEPVWTDTHLPGDWMWPAERWVAGQIVRDRVLVQLPGRVEPGRYAVTWRLRHRPTGAVLAPEGQDGRVEIGELRVRERAWWDWAMIRPTAPREPTGG